MTPLLYVLGMLLFAVGIALSIGLHEIGHLVPAKRFGVRVTQYMIGFGPTIWSRRKGETEYGVKAIPLGGYIRMIGMFPPKRGADQNLVLASSTGRMSLLMEQARNQSMEELEPGDEKRVFYRLSVPKKVIVMMGGPTMNLVIAAVLLTITTTAFGSLVPSTTVGSVSACVLPASAPATATCQAADTKAPAAAAGIQPGDKILSFDGKPATSWDALTSSIRSSSSTTVPIVVRRDGRDLTLQITPILTDRPVFDSNGDVEHTASGAVRTERVGFLGVSAGQRLQPESITTVPGKLWTGISGTAGVVLRIPQKMVGVAQAAFGSRDPRPERPGERRRRRPVRRGDRQRQGHRWVRRRAEGRGPAERRRGRAEHRAVRLQPDPAAAPGRRSRRGRALGGRPAHRSPGSATAPTRARPMSPACCPSRTPPARC